MPPRVISPQLQKQRDAQSRKKVPGIRHPLLLSFLAGKLAFKHIYKDDDSLYEAIKSTPVFANILADLEDDSVFVLYNVLKSLETELFPSLRPDIDRASKNMKSSLTQLESDKMLTRFIGNHSYLATLMIILSRGQAFHSRLLAQSDEPCPISSDSVIEKIRKKDKLLLMTSNTATRGQLTNARKNFERSFQTKKDKDSDSDMTWLCFFIYDDQIKKRLLTTYSTTPRLVEIIKGAESSAKEALVAARQSSPQELTIARGNILKPDIVDNVDPVRVDGANEFECFDRATDIKVLKESDMFPTIHRVNYPIHFCGIFSSMEVEDFEVLKTRVTLIEEMMTARSETVFDAKAWSYQLHRVIHQLASSVPAGYNACLEKDNNYKTGFQELRPSTIKDYVSMSSRMIAFLRAEAVADGFRPNGFQQCPPNYLHFSFLKVIFEGNFAGHCKMKVIRTAPSAHGIGEYSIPLSFLLSLSWSAEILK